MRYKSLSSPKGTGIEDREEMYAKRDIFYLRPDLLPNDVSVRKSLEFARDTIAYVEMGERSSFELNSMVVQRDVPVLRLIDKEQEGHALTFQKWKGIVKCISEDTFVAQVADLISSVPDEEAEFSLSDIQNDDKELLSVGAVFYWCIGYVYSRSNQVTRASFLRFQRLPLYSQDSVTVAVQKAKDIQAGITWL